MSSFQAASHSPNIPNRQIGPAENLSTKPSCGRGHSTLQTQPISSKENLSTKELFLRGEAA